MKIKIIAIIYYASIPRKASRTNKFLAVVSLFTLGKQFFPRSLQPFSPSRPYKLSELTCTGGVGFRANVKPVDMPSNTGSDLCGLMIPHFLNSSHPSGCEFPEGAAPAASFSLNYLISFASIILHHTLYLRYDFKRPNSPSIVSVTCSETQQGCHFLN